jgi:glucose/arabinose dehydrogenase
MRVLVSIITFIIISGLFHSCRDNKTSNENKLDSAPPADIRFDTVSEGLEVPWSIVFTSDIRMLVNERPGRIRIIENNILKPEPLYTVNNVSTGSEEGLMGLALDPEYQVNKNIYISYAYENNGDMFVRIVRLKDEGNKLIGETIILDGIKADKNHAGCRLRFGPDKKLFITTGDATERELAQRTDNLEGKILRINSDGTIPNDNPFPNSPIWTIGHRNPQGIDWYPDSEIMWSTEHGPSGFDGPGGGDEVNVIVKGKNYGWPVVSHDKNKEGFIAPLLVFTPAEAPASGMFYSGTKLTYYKNNFLFGCLRGNGIIKVIVDENDPSKFKSYEKIAKNYGRVREVVQGPDGYIYFSTSNRDGRGSEREGDDKIVRILPK